jgi:hypothetical protein
MIVSDSNPFSPPSSQVAGVQEYYTMIAQLLLLVVVLKLCFGRSVFFNTIFFLFSKDSLLHNITHVYIATLGLINPTFSGSFPERLKPPVL